MQNDVVITEGQELDLGKMVWKTQDRKAIWRIGEMDRKTLGFKYGGAERQHGLSDKCPGNMTFTIGRERTEDWCYAQSVVGSWTVAFTLSGSAASKSKSAKSYRTRAVGGYANANGTTPAAVLAVSLAGYSTGVDNEISVNGVVVGSMLSSNIPNDPALYRSGTTAGEWHYFEFYVPTGVLKSGGQKNEVVFRVTKGSRWHGFMWDSVALEWA